MVAEAQNWFIADAVCIEANKESSGWQDCRARIFVDNGGNIKIFTADNTLVYRRIGEHSTHNTSNGDKSMSWPCVDDEGIKCYVSFDIIEGTSFLMLDYSDFCVIYHIEYDE